MTIDAVRMLELDRSREERGELGIGLLSTLASIEDREELDATETVERLRGRPHQGPANRTPWQAYQIPRPRNR